MFSFFKKKPVAPEAAPAEPLVLPAATPPAPQPAAAPLSGAPAELVPVIVAAEPEKKSWMTRLKAGLSKTSNTLSVLFVGAKIDDALYEELEAALLMSDAGIDATEFLLTELKKKVKEDKLLDAAAVKAALKVLLIDLLDRRWKSASSWAATSRW